MIKAAPGVTGLDGVGMIAKLSQQTFLIHSTQIIAGNKNAARSPIGADACMQRARGDLPDATRGSVRPMLNGNMQRTEICFVPSIDSFVPEIDQTQRARFLNKRYSR